MDLAVTASIMSQGQVQNQASVSVLKKSWTPLKWKVMH